MLAMSDDSAVLSIDFLVGFTIFLLAFIWVLSIIPGLLIGLQAFTIDYDAVAYRTGVILVEDPGQKSTNETSWEIATFQQNYNKADVLRFGLAVSREDPNILSLDKVNRFFDNTTFNYPGDYHNRSIFGDYPYRFNISLKYIGSPESAKSIGEVLPEGYGYIRRFVKIKSMSNATIDGSNLTFLNNERFINGDNTTRTHIFSILLNNTGLTGEENQIKDAAYQIIPGKESFMINLTYLNQTIVNAMNVSQENCFNISLNNTIVSDSTRTITFFDPIIDEVPLHMTTPQPVKRNVSILYNTTANRRGLNWEAPQITISLIFNLIPTGEPGCTMGSRFLNNTYTAPFDYDNNPNNVTQPQLRDAVVEVAVW